jgi:aminoglycoside phosphotransferase family enzyme
MARLEHIPLDAAAADGLAEKVAFLGDPAAYVPRPADVVAIETHMAWVFLAGERAYKIKKPVRYPFLDFATLERRERTCRDEVRLNRRLAPDVYLGVVALTRETDGRLAIAGGGRPVDWLVKMRRLAPERMLDQVIRAGGPGKADIAALGDVLARFYGAARPASLAPGAYAARFRAEHELNRLVIGEPEFAPATGACRDVVDGVARFLDRRAPMLEERARAGGVVDGHGDLRPEHVCLCSPPVIIDCLEFNRDLRLVDPFDEVSFLGLECELVGARWIADALTRHCARSLTAPAAELIAFYRAYRACLRARLMLAHLMEPDPREPDKWLPKALRYLELGRRDGLTPRLR